MSEPSGVMVEILAVMVAGGALWVLVPVVAFALRLTRVKVDVTTSPESANESDFDEASYRRYLKLGFRYGGSTRQHAWFINPTAWYWRTPSVTRWLVSADDKTFLSFSKGTPQRQRVTAVSVLEDGGMVQTSYPDGGTGAVSMPLFSRIEIPDEEAKGLLARHDQHVASVGEAAARRTSLKDVARQDAHFSELFVMRSGGAEGYEFVAKYFALPALVFGMTCSSRLEHGGALWSLAAGVLIFAAAKLILLPWIRAKRLRTVLRQGG